MGTSKFVASLSEIRMPQGILKPMVGICSEGNLWKTVPLTLSLTNPQKILKDTQLQSAP